MARELGMNPKKFGKLDNWRQEPWKDPLSVFIERLYQKQFGRVRPLETRTIEEIAKADYNKRIEKKQHARRGVALGGIEGEADHGLRFPQAKAD